ncbi:MAG: TetR/AcrR family transcriptional regulator, partial [Treponema sp.]|nr:TetR/AcrR family transcriptional regulator [Treponema sp.]
MPRSPEDFENMRDLTRKKIETAALSLFARKGLSVKIGEIAQKAGVSQGLLYSHYLSKDALIIELAHQATAISSENTAMMVHGNDSAADKIKRISAMMCQMFTFVPQGIEYFMFMIQLGMSDFKLPDTGFAEIRSPLENLTSVVAQGQAEGSVVGGDPMQLT